MLLISVTNGQLTQNRRAGNDNSTSVQALVECWDTFLYIVFSVLEYPICIAGLCWIVCTIIGQKHSSYRSSLVAGSAEILSIPADGRHPVEYERLRDSVQMHEADEKTNAQGTERDGSLFCEETKITYDAYQSSYRVS
jgi:hypothetical protein